MVQAKISFFLVNRAKQEKGENFFSPHSVGFGW
jgi:hypothetical protein